MKAKNFHDPVYIADVLFVTDCELNDLNSYLEKRGYPTEKDDGKFTAYTATFERPLKGGGKEIQYFVWVSNKKDFYALLHESNHLVQRILVDRGVPYNGENTEVIAYYQDFWFRQLWRFMGKKKGRN